MVDFSENGCFLVKRGAPQSPVAEMNVKPCHILRILEVRDPGNHVIFMNFQLFAGNRGFRENSSFPQNAAFSLKSGNSTIFMKIPSISPYV